jgi:ribosomal protein S18 acetylase RimI-like enzyme
MEKRVQRVLSCLPHTIDGAWTIDSVATLPGYRRRGITGRLLEAILETGRRRGCGMSQVNIYVGNLPAQKAYEKMGFSIHEERLCPAFMEEIGAPGMVSMTMDLEE